MLSAGLILVRQDRDGRHASGRELIDVYREPLPRPRTAGICGRGQPDGAQGEDVLLAFRDIDVRLMAQFGEPEQHASNEYTLIGLVQLPEPATTTVGSPLLEAFWRIPHDLVQQRAGFVTGYSYVASMTPLRPLAVGNGSRSRASMWSAARMALNEHPAWQFTNHWPRRP